jgi:hypothetical protein
MNSDDGDTLQSRSASNPQGAVIDAQQCSLAALENHPEFFNADHMQRVHEARDIVAAFFPICKGVHVNHRANRGKCFSVVKVDHPQWPQVSFKTKQTRYVLPLQALGAQIVYTPHTHSVLIRIK